MHDQALLLSYVSRAYRDLAESAALHSSHANREDVLRVVQWLKNSADQLVAAWPTFSPPEAEAITDHLLAATCRSAADGTLKVAEVSREVLVLLDLLVEPRADACRLARRSRTLESFATFALSLFPRCAAPPALVDGRASSCS